MYLLLLRMSPICFRIYTPHNVSSKLLVVNFIVKFRWENVTSHVRNNYQLVNSQQYDSLFHGVLSLSQQYKYSGVRVTQQVSKPKPVLNVKSRCQQSSQNIYFKSIILSSCLHSGFVVSLNKPHIINLISPLFTCCLLTNVYVYSKSMCFWCAVQYMQFYLQCNIIDNQDQ